MPFGRRFAGGMRLTALFVVAAALVEFAAPPTALAQQSDLAWRSTATWTADPVAHRVHVDLQIVAVSHATDLDGRRYYYSRLEMAVPTSTAGYVAEDGQGNSLPIYVVARTTLGTVIDVSFRRRLYSSQSIAFELKFDLVDPGGTPDRDLRIGQDLMQFPVQAFGSPGMPGSSVAVIFPAGFTVQEPVGTLTGTHSTAGTTTYSSGSVPDPTAVTAWFTAARDVPANGYRTVTLTLGSIPVIVQYWADDASWAEQVTHVLQSGYPILRDMIGLGDPSNSSLIVEEVVSEGIGGFSGDYDAAASLMRVSYFADPTVILHELAHLWLNAGVTSEHWISEGFATYYAEQAVLRLGLPDRAPVLSPTLMLSGVPLNDWTGTEASGTAAEAYLYAASLEVARRIAARAGPDALRQVWVQARARQSPFGQAAPGPGSMDWRGLLDSLELITRQSYTSIWQQWIVTPSQAGLMSDRSAAWADYSDTQATAGGWTLPPDLRAQMADWKFGSARLLLVQARQIIGAREQIDAIAASQHLSTPSTLRRDFETVGTDAASAQARAELQAIQAIAAADQARMENEGAARLVGLIGTDPDSELAKSRAAFSRGDMASATSLADSARDAWSGAKGVGQLRIVGTVAGSAGILLLLAVLVWTRSIRRPGDRRVGAADPVESTDA